MSHTAIAYELLRNMKNAAGEIIPPTELFRAYRDNIATDSDAAEARIAKVLVELREETGMAMIFINSLLYIWPIATLIYGAENALPITAIVAWDASVTFTIFIVTMELITGKTPLAETAKRIALNPILLSIFAGLILNAAGIALAQPILTAFGFAGAAAAPLTLFALGVILHLVFLNLINIEISTFEKNTKKMPCPVHKSQKKDTKE